MFDWIDDAAAEIISNAYRSLFMGVEQLLDTVSVTPQEFMNGVPWTSIMGFSENCIKPIAWSILTLFLLIELANVMKRQDSRGMDSIYFIAVIFLKIGCAKLLMDNIDLIIGMIFEISNYITIQAKEFMSISSSSIDIEAAIENFTNIVEEEGTLSKLLDALFAQILNLANMIMDAICYIIIYLRFIEIFIYCSVGPLPVATFPSQEHSTIMKNWIKRLVAQGVHVVLIVACIYLYTVMISQNTVVFGGVIGAFMQVLMYKLMLVIALFQTGGWARSLANAT